MGSAEYWNRDGSALTTDRLHIFLQDEEILRADTFFFATRRRSRRTDSTGGERSV